MELDTTLTQSGKAADAAAVGARMTALEKLGGITVLEPAEDDIPKLYITGTPPESKAEEDVRVRVRYKSKTRDFEYPSTLKVQGNLSVGFPKKNFTWKLYADDTYESKIKVAFRHWPKYNKFVLKAHWVDHSHIRNVGAAKIFGAMVRSRSDFDMLPEELRNAPNTGATDGFTVKVFVNGIYWGLYELIVPKDKLFGQDGDNPAHSIVNSEHNHKVDCAFATTTPTIGGNWSEEFQDSMSAGVSTGLKNFIAFVAGASDADYVANLANYCDVQSVIDFDIFARLMLTSDSLSQNQILFSYDDGKKFYEGGWDFDNVLGLFPTLTFAPYDTPFQEGYKAYLESGNINLLYKRTEELFLDWFQSRYWELRSSVLSESSVIDVFERLADVISHYDGLLAEDYAATTAEGAFTGIPLKNSNNIQQIREFVAKRFPYMDGVVRSMTPPGPCTGITLDKRELAFTEEGAQTLTATVTPDGCTDAITWESDTPSVATVNGGVVTTVANGTAVITARCGEFSASCAVTVSGMPEPVPCTGITLNKSELMLEGEVSETLTATVTPEDTTDSVTWESDNPSVATVNGGVVTAVKNGNATITAKCGEQTAMCVVTVSGIATNIASGVGWHLGYINARDGAIKTSQLDVHTDMIDISGMSSLNVSWNFVGNYIWGKSCNYAFYNDAEFENSALVSAGSPSEGEAKELTFEEIPDGARYFAISFYLVKVENPYEFDGITIRETADGEIIGRVPYTELPTE